MDHDISKPDGVTFTLNSVGLSAYKPQDLTKIQPGQFSISLSDPYLSRGTVCSGTVDQDGEFYCSLLSHKFDYNDKTLVYYDAAFSSPKYCLSFFSLSEVNKPQISSAERSCITSSFIHIYLGELAFPVIKILSIPALLIS